VAATGGTETILVVEDDEGCARSRAADARGQRLRRRARRGPGRGGAGVHAASRRDPTCC
jgi:hypothetical protein